MPIYIVDIRIHSVSSPLPVVKASFLPSIMPELMAYMTEIGKYAKRFQWPSWVIYDQNFRQEMSSRPGLMWTRAEPTIFTQCFLGMAKHSAEAWCKYCHSMDHALDLCGRPQEKPLRSSHIRKDLLRFAAITTRRKAVSLISASICIGYHLQRYPPKTSVLQPTQTEGAYQTALRVMEPAA